MRQYVIRNILDNYQEGIDKFGPTFLTLCDIEISEELIDGNTVNLNILENELQKLSDAEVLRVFTILCLQRCV